MYQVLLFKFMRHLSKGSMLYQRSYEANWKLVTLWVRNTPVDGEEYKWLQVSIWKINHKVTISLFAW